MITKQIKTTEGLISLSIPTTLDELTIGQLADLQANPEMSDAEIVSVLSYCPLETIYLARDINELKKFKEAIDTLTYELQFAYNAEAIPETVRFERLLGEKLSKPKTVKVVRKLSLEPAGAYLNARNVIAEEINKAKEKFGDAWEQNFNPSVQACIELLAQFFFYPATGKKYDEYQVQKFIDDVKYLPVSQALPIARYFFLKYPNLQMPKIGFWRQVQHQIKQRQALKNLKNSGQ